MAKSKIKKTKKVVSKQKHLKSKKSNSSKLDQVIRIENKLLHEEKNIEAKENSLQREEKKIEKEEKELKNVERSMTNLKGIEDAEMSQLSSLKAVEDKEISELEKLEQLENEIKTEVDVHPLAKVTVRDISKGLIGAFIGLAIHYTFTYGVEIAEKLTMTRATVLFPITFIVGLLFIYATGFRKVQDKSLLKYMPLRLSVLYICALLMSMFVLYLFYPNFGHSFEESYKMISAVMLAAVVGACTADLLGKE